MAYSAAQREQMIKEYMKRSGKGRNAAMSWWRTTYGSGPSGPNTKARAAAANARDRAADMRDSANARDTAAMRKDLKSKTPGTDVVVRRASAVVPRKTSEVVKPTFTTQEVVNIVKNAPSKAAAVTKIAKVIGHLGNAVMIYDTVKNPDFGMSKLDAWSKKHPDASLADKFAASVKNTVGMSLEDKKPSSKAAAKKIQYAAGARVASGKSVNTAPRADSKDAGRGAASAKSNIAAGRVTKPAAKSAASKTNKNYTPVNGVYTVKSGDNLWNIAQANKTTVSSLLKANPVIAERIKNKKVDIFSGSKVRIPKGK